MPGNRVSALAALVIATAILISVVTTIVCINSAPIISCDETYGCFGPIREDPSLWSVIQRQEWYMLAAYLIFLMFSAYALALIVERFLAFSKARRQTRQFQSKAGEAFFRGQFATAAHFARAYPASPLAFVINAALNECGDADERRPVMRLRQQAIVAKTIELKRGLWHLSAIGNSLELLVVLLLCVDGINAERMIRYDTTLFAYYFAREFTDSLHLIVFCLLIGFVVLVAHKFFTARIEQFQLEMDRLSLAFIERLSSQPCPVATAIDSPIDSYKTGIIAKSQTAELQRPAAFASELSNTWSRCSR
jgi:biopolymer transport protein TolQ